MWCNGRCAGKRHDTLAGWDCREPACGRCCRRSCLSQARLWNFMCSVALPKRPDSYRTITRGASRDGGARRRRDNNRRRQEAPFKRRGGTAGHKSWEKHAWQNCHGPTLRPENMSPSISLLLCPVHPVALAQVAHRRPLPSFAPFAVLCYSSKPPSFTTTFLRTVELQRKTSLRFLWDFFMCLLSIHRSGWIIGRNREQEKWTFYAKYIDRKNFVARSERISSSSLKKVWI